MTTNEEIYQRVVELLRAGEAACLVTVVAARGTTPRGVGSKMLLAADGATWGTVGGGEVEAAARRDAQEALRSGTSRLAEYAVHGQTGGDAVQVFVEVLQPRPTLLIAGGGHVAQALAEMAHHLGLRVVVIEEREDWARRDRFPYADQIVCTPFAGLTGHVSVPPDAYVVILTHSHETDELVLRQILNMPAAYVGMIGSARKVGAILEHLCAVGVAQEKLDAVYAPIGLRTGGETPADIALSILAEVNMVRHGESGEPMRGHRSERAGQG